MSTEPDPATIARRDQELAQARQYWAMLYEAYAIGVRAVGTDEAKQTVRKLADDPAWNIHEAFAIVAECFATIDQLSGMVAAARDYVRSGYTAGLGTAADTLRDALGL